MLKEKIRQTIRKYGLIENGEHIIIGLSGGPDSVCLFDILKGIEEEMNLTLHAVHVNHKFRPGAAEEDQAYVEKLCSKSGVECTAVEADCTALAKELKITGEEAGRKVRYSAFFAKALAIAEHLKEKGTGKSVKIAVAHNMNDQAETLLFRLARGTGVDGLCGMEYEREVTAREIEETILPELMPEAAAMCGTKKEICSDVKVKIIRPLLDTGRSEIEDYCKNHELTPRTDFTNLQPVYARNKIRLELIPYADKLLGTDIAASMGRLARTAGEDSEFIWTYVKDLKHRAEESSSHDETGEKGTKRAFSLSLLQEAAPALLSRLIADVFAEMGLSKDVSFVHIDAARELIMKGETGKKTDFPHGYVLSVSYDKVLFSKKGENEDANKEAKEMGAGAGSKVRASILTGSEWEKLREENPKFSKKAGLGKAYALFDLEKLCERRNVPETEISLLQEEINVAPDSADISETQVITKADAIFEKLGLRLRTRAEGDYVSLGEGRGNKKLQRYFMDEKVPREEREELLLLTAEREVLWVLDRDCRGWGRTAKELGISEKTKRILLLECK